MVRLLFPCSDLQGVVSEDMLADVSGSCQLLSDRLDEVWLVLPLFEFTL
jgi:hypothetical protein